MSEIEFLDVNDPKTKRSDRIYPLVDLQTGQIREVPCGPVNSSHISGSRQLMWDKIQGEAVIPPKFRGRFMFYEQFCSDPKVNASVGLEVAEGAKRFAVYKQFMAMRGHGGSAKLIAKLDTRRLLHPALEPIRARAKAARGQVVADEEALERLLGQLGDPLPALELPEESEAPDDIVARVSSDLAALLEDGEEGEALLALVAQRMGWVPPGGSAGPAEDGEATEIDAVEAGGSSGSSATGKDGEAEAGEPAGSSEPSSKRKRSRK